MALHSTDLLTARGVAHLVVHETSGSTSYETIPPVPLEASGGVLSTVDMVVQRRDGPRRLRSDDDDDEVRPVTVQLIAPSVHLCPAKLTTRCDHQRAVAKFSEPRVLNEAAQESTPISQRSELSYNYTLKTRRKKPPYQTAT